MKRTILALALCLAGCESLPIPTSTTDPPHPAAAVDLSCMQDCEGTNADAELCRMRCAK